MNGKKALINAKIVNEGEIFNANIFIDGEKIEKITPETGNLKYYEVFDFSDKIIIPGVIDTHVHFREPGLTEKGDIFSESKAALAGGITSFFDMPNTKPPTIDFQTLEQKYEIARNKSFINYAFYLGATNDNFKLLKELDFRRFAGVKIFFASSTGNMLVNDFEILEKFFEYKNLNFVIHSEDNDLIIKNLKRFKNIDDLLYPHYTIRSKEACISATKKLVDFATKQKVKLHFLHISTAEELNFFADTPVENKLITAETTVNYLWFDKQDCSKNKFLLKCNPSLKDRTDKEALRNALKTNKIDTIATDHAPHLLTEKKNDYFASPSGIPSVRFSLLSMLELVKEGILDITNLVEKMSHNPAKIFNIKGRGFIREGYFADLVVIDFHRKSIIDTSKILHKCGWSPFSDMEFNSVIQAVFVNGKLGYYEGEILSEKMGKRIEFVR